MPIRAKMSYNPTLAEKLKDWWNRFEVNWAPWPLSQSALYFAIERDMREKEMAQISVSQQDSSGAGVRMGFDANGSPVITARIAEPTTDAGRAELSRVYGGMVAQSGIVPAQPRDICVGKVINIEIEGLPCQVRQLSGDAYWNAYDPRPWGLLQSRVRSPSREYREGDPVYCIAPNVLAFAPQLVPVPRPVENNLMIDFARTPEAFANHSYPKVSSPSVPVYDDPPVSEPPRMPDIRRILIRDE